MDIEKSLTLSAPAEQIWTLLLDPQVMGACVPGMKSIEVISGTEYLAEMHVKFSFLSAKFKLRTEVVAQDRPRYLRSQGTRRLCATVLDYNERMLSLARELGFEDDPEHPPEEGVRAIVLPLAECSIT